VNVHTRRGGLWILIVAALVGGAFLLRWAYPAMRVNRGIFEHLRGNNVRAVEILSRANLRPPDYRPVHYLVSSLINVGQADEAERRLQGYSHEFPQWVAPRFELACLLMRHGDWEAAWPTMAWASDLSSSAGTPGFQQEDLALARAVRAFGEGRVPEVLALAGWDPAATESSGPDGGENEDLRALVQAMALMRLGRWREAERPLRTSLRLYPDNPRPAAMLALVLASQGDWDRAWHQADVARAIDADRAQAILLKEIRRQIRLTNSAAADGASVAALGRSDALAWLAQMYADAAAWQELVALVDSQPHPERITNAVVWHRLSLAEYFTGDLGGQLKARERAFEVNPDWPYEPHWTTRENETHAYWFDWQWRPLQLPPAEALPPGAARFGDNAEMISLYSTTALETSIEVEKEGWYRLVLWGYGQSSGAVWPLIELSVSSAPPTAQYLNHRNPRPHVSDHYFTAGRNTLRIAYVNDAERLAPGEDRNAVIREIWIEREPLVRE
jgi:Flp pilus assembly protein TadD